MKTLQLFKDTLFTEKDHSYTDRKTGKKYTSSTQFVGKHKKPFDTEYWARYTVLKDNHIRVFPSMSLSQLSKKIEDNLLVRQVELRKDEWEKNRVRAASEGTKVHDALEQYIWRRRVTDVGNVLKYKQGTRFLDTLNSMNEYVVLTEYVISDKEWGISGMIDLVTYNPITECYSVWDYKTDKEIKFSNKYDKMYEPFSEFDDCNFNKYTIQLNIYTKILERVDLPVNNITIVHLTEQDYKTYPIDRIDIDSYVQKSKQLKLF